MTEYSGDTIFKQNNRLHKTSMVHLFSTGVPLIRGKDRFDENAKNRGLIYPIIYLCQ